MKQLNLETTRRPVIITGAGGGIGRAVAVRLANEGYPVALIGRSTSKLRRTARCLPHGIESVSVSVDVTNRRDLEKAIAYVASTIGHLGGIVACAGISGPNYITKKVDRWEEILSVNLSGVYYSFFATYRHLTQDSIPKHMIAISSILARIGLPSHSAYCASKAGLTGLVHALALEWASEKIYVNAIAPGWVKTPMSQRSLQRLARRKCLSADLAVQKALEAVPLCRMSQPEEIADLIAFLFINNLSITGQTIDCNNGAWFNQ